MITIHLTAGGIGGVFLRAKTGGYRLAPVRAKMSTESFFPIMPTPKPTRRLKLTGNFRPDKHGNRVDDILFEEDIPTPSAELEDVGEAMWNRLIEIIPPEILTKADGPGITSLCKLWQTHTQFESSDDMQERRPRVFGPRLRQGDGSEVAISAH